MAKQRKSKTIAPEMISISELGRRANCTRSAASIWLKKQEAQGICLAQASDRLGKLVDANNPIIKQYISNAMGKSNRKEGANSGQRLQDSVRKLMYQCEKQHLQNEILRGNYISNVSVLALLDKLTEIENIIFSGISDRILDNIHKNLCEVKPKDRAAAKKIIDDAVKSAAETNRRIVQNYRRDNASKVTKKINGKKPTP